MEIKFQTKGGSMLITINNGKLVLNPETAMESYALESWSREVNSPIVVKLITGVSKNSEQVLKTNKVEWEK
jgi:hypothetical protein